MTRGEYIRQYLTDEEAAQFDLIPKDNMWNLLDEPYEPNYQQKLLERAKEMGMDTGDEPEKHEAAGLLRCSFAWDMSPAGWEFWRDVCDRLNRSVLS